MPTNYVANPNGNPLDGWSKSGGTLTSDGENGVRWTGTGTHTLTIAVKSTAAYNTWHIIAGLQVRRNKSTSSGLSKVVLTTTGGFLTSYPRISATDFPVGAFIELPNGNPTQKYNFAGQTDTLAIQITTEGGAYDFNFKDAGVYRQTDAPADAVLATGDATFSVVQADDSLTATFTRLDGVTAVDEVTWEWGDGSPSVTGNADDLRTVSHAFPRVGVYTVKLTAKNTVGASTDGGSNGFPEQAPRYQTSSASKVVTVPVGEFTAKFTYQLDFPVLTVDASSSVAPIRGPVETYAWNWGDGKVDQGVRQTHEYAAAGNYTVTLTTSNSITKATSQATKVISVGQAAQQIGAPVYEIGLFLDDPASTVGSTNLQAEMVPILRAAEIRHNWTANESNALTFQAPSTWLTDALGDGVTADNLRSDVVLRFNFGTGWIEMPNCRYIVSSAVADPLNPRTAVQVTCYLAASADMDGVFFTPEFINRAYSQDEIKANYSRVFAASNPGVIGRSLLPVATTPGSGGANLPFLNVDFSTTADSKGQPWVTTLSNLSVPPEANGSGLQKTLVDNGAIDWYAQGNVIRWFNVGTCGRRAAGDAVPTLIPGVDIASAPQTRALASQAWGAVVVSGSKAPFVSVDTDATAESAATASYRGRRYVAVQSADADSEAAALAIAKPTLTQIRRARDGEMQRDLIFYPGMPWAPYRDYWVGDTINAPGPNGTMIATKVVGITTTKTSTNGLQVSVTLGKAFPIDPLASKVASLSGGQGLSVGAVGERPPSATSGFIETLVSKKITNDSTTVNAGTTGLVLEGKTPGGTASLELQSDGTSAYVNSLTVYNRTYSSAANMYVTSNGRIGRSTSASKYKTNIAEQDYGTAILDLDVKTWYDLASCEGFMHRDDADVSRQVGLIAEDLVDAGLSDFVQHNWETGEVEGIQYDRVALLLIPIVRDQRDQLDALRGELDARDLVLEQLLTRVAALESAPTMNESAS